MRARVSISAFWFLYLGGLGIFFPYYSLYLRENAGLSGTQVGLVVSTLQLMGMLVQPLWGQVADRTGSRSRLLALLALGAAVGFALLSRARGFPVLLIATAGLAAFHQAVLPTCMSVSLASLREAGRHAFGVARMFGTLGFLVFVVGFPRLLDWSQRSRDLEAPAGGASEPGLELMFVCIAGLALAAALVALSIPRAGAVSLRAERGDWRQLLRHGPFLRFLVFAMVAYACLQGPMSLFPIFVRAHGGTLDDVSHMWILMLILEIPLVALSGASLARLGPRGLLAMGVACAALRWTACALTDDLRVIYAVQILHGPTVAGLVIGGPLYVDATVPERLRSTGQALLAMVGVGMGGMTSNVLAGWLIDRVSADAPALLGGIGACVLALSLRWLLPRPTRPDEAPPSEPLRLG